MKKTLLIYNSPILIEIFREIKDNLDFNFLTYTEDAINNLDLTDKNNYIIITQTSNKIKNAKVFNVPIKIKILLEKINIWFLAKNFSSQSSVEISNYCLDLNSRKISRNEKFLYLTEKEVQLIMFIETNSVVRLKDIQKDQSKSDANHVKTELVVLMLLMSLLAPILIIAMLLWLVVRLLQLMLWPLVFLFLVLIILHLLPGVQIGIFPV